MSLHRFQRDTLPVMPWKNGGGSTCEIACWPPGAGLGDFGWRISIATIAQAGPFSVFEGVDRRIMLLGGDGVRLQSSDGLMDHRLDRLHVPFAFSGDAAINCTLLGGPSTDFNVMTRRGRWHAELQMIENTALIDPTPHGLLMALRGNWGMSDVRGGAWPVCEAGQGLWWTDVDAHNPWQIESREEGAQLILVRLMKG